MDDSKLLIATAAFILFAVIAGQALADDVKYCINHETGKVIAVKKNTPCPSPTAEL